MMLMGMRRLRPNEKSPFHFQNIVFMLLFMVFNISVIAYMSFEAKTFQEYTESFYAFISVSFTSGALVLVYSMTADIYRFLDGLIIIVEGRK